MRVLDLPRRCDTTIEYFVLLLHSALVTSYFSCDVAATVSKNNLAKLEMASVAVHQESSSQAERFESFC